ncbi:MAG: hypothetical protein IKP88_08730 [Lachnospiraceae bacterium]|nr:hypothetical protein [Lachnospiraceae bacterium]
MKKFLFIFLIALLSCACLSCNSKKGGGNDTNSPEITEGTLLGADEIYPTVMVNGYLYEWRRGRALHYLPNDSIYYGDINHIDGKNPEKNCDFVSVFPVSGQIYTVPDNIDYVYLQLTTNWAEEFTVVFDLIE